MWRFLIVLLCALPMEAFSAPENKSAVNEQLELIERGEIIHSETSIGDIEALINTQQAEIFRLKDQLSIVRDYNDDFLAVVLWSLGVILTLTIVLMSFNWFQNSRSIRREMESIKTELEGSLKLLSQDLKHEIEIEVENLSELLDKKSRVIVEEAFNPLNSGLENLNLKILRLQYDAIEAKAIEWKQQNVLTNALRYSAYLIECAIEIDWDWKLSNAIDLMNEIFDEIDTKGIKDSRIDAQDVVKTEAIVKKCPDSHKSLRNSLLQRLRKLH